MPVPPSVYSGGKIVYVTVTKRNPEPQDRSCNGQQATNSDANWGESVPFGQLLSYGPDGSPTITITKTLFSSAEVTSTTSTASSAQASGSTSTTTTTGTSTVYHTSTFTSIPTTSLAITLSAADLSSSTGSSTSKSHSISTSASNSTADPGGAHSGKVAGSVIGSFAAFGMIGFLIWYCCTKKAAGSRFKAKLNIKRRKSSSAKSPKTPQLEDQTSKKAQSTMLERTGTAPAEENELNAFLAPSVHLNNQQNNTEKSSPATARKPVPSELPGSPGLPRPSWIGMAVSSSTPPNTPPLPRSNSQKINRSIAPSVGTVKEDEDLYGPPKEPPSSLMPAPLRPPTKPAPIVTTPQIARSNTISPLSPRAMMSAVGNTGSRMWQRASQALSPSGYQKMPFDRNENSYAGSNSRKDSNASARNPELEIGAQTDKGWNGNWI